MWPFRQPPADAVGRLATLPPAAARYVVLDTELTGLDERRDSIVSIGALRLVSGRIVVGDRFYREVRPDSALSRESIVLHGITPGELRDRPGVETALAGFTAFFGDDILVGHFLEIDLSFLRAALARAGRPPIANPTLDTWPLYNWLSSRPPLDGVPGLPRLQDPRLPELAAALGVRSHNQHNALGDAFVTAQVFQRLLRRLEHWGVATVGQMLRIGRPTRAPDHRPCPTAPPLT